MIPYVYLLLVSDAECPFGLDLCSSKGWKKQTRKDCNDGDYNQ